MQQLLELLDKTPSRFIPLATVNSVLTPAASANALTNCVFENIVKVYAFTPGNIRLKGFGRRGGQGESRQTLEGTHPAFFWEVQNLQPELPHVPSRTSRDYQMEGFILAHLAHWGGSLLGRSMGLGKPCRRWLSSSSVPMGTNPIVALLRA